MFYVSLDLQVKLWLFLVYFRNNNGWLRYWYHRIQEELLRDFDRIVSTVPYGKQFACITSQRQTRLEIESQSWGGTRQIMSAMPCLSHLGRLDLHVWGVMLELRKSWVEDRRSFVLIFKESWCS